MDGTLSFGGGYNFNSRFSLGGQIIYNGLGVSRGVLREFAVPDGNARIWAFTTEPRLNFAPRRKFTLYVVGGVGYYRRVVEFTQPTLAAVTVFDPFFFTFFPVLVPANVAYCLRAVPTFDLRRIDGHRVFAGNSESIEEASREKR